MLKPEELIVDNFAGGGGASTGIFMATGRHPDIAINHDPEAIAMHRINHPGTKHYCEDVFSIDPAAVCTGRPVGLAWFSPDCKHFSKAKGGKPVNKKIRGLAWVVVKWARAVKPRIIILENVEEFETCHLIKLKGTCKDGQPVTEPMPTVQAGGLHIGEVRAFLIQYYSNGSGKTGASLDRPAPTVTERHRLGLVTIQGQDYQIVDIGMRMLQPRELYLAQGFPAYYIIEFDYNGKALPKSSQVKMCGNSVSPYPAEKIVTAQLNAVAISGDYRGERPAKQLGLL